MTDQLQKVRHDYLRYANCWEDAEVLLEGLSVQPGDNVLSIGSAGDNSFSLLTQKPELVLAVDVNFVQIQLIELKKAAFLGLDYQEFLKFLGFEPKENRRVLFDKLELTDSLKEFWLERWSLIEGGIIYQGKFENYFKLFRTKVLKFIHGSSKIETLFQEKTAFEQSQFYNSKWDNKRWKWLFKLFFSKFVMGRFGRDPAFLKEVDVQVGKHIYQKAAAHLRSVNCQQNPFLQFMLQGRFKEQLPHYAREENFDTIKSQCHHLQTHYGLAETALEKHPNLRFQRFNLSNIFEYMPAKLFESVTQQLVDCGDSNAQYAYWNLMVPRCMSAINSQLTHQENLSSELSQKDHGFFYSGVIIDTKK